MIKTFKHTWPPLTVCDRLKASCQDCMRGLPALTCSLGPWYCNNLVVVHICGIGESAGQVANEGVLHKDTVCYWVPGVVPSTQIKEQMLFKESVQWTMCAQFRFTVLVVFCRLLRSLQFHIPCLSLSGLT